MSRRRLLPAVTLVALVLVTTALPAAGGVSISADRRGTTALRAAERALDGSRGADPTMALRDLSLVRSDLPPAQRAEAEALLARPTDGGADPQGDGYSVPEAKPSCSRVLCVHYVATTKDKPADVGTDTDANGVPDWVDLTRDTFTDVHHDYVGAGWRAPRPDGHRGGNRKTDVYLADLDSRGLYGYCVSDERGVTFSDHVRTWAYCVVDNDYANVAAHTPTENLQVTAAHEYLHAIQFGYDYGEDAWLYEATATWAEDELYDDVDDSASFLRFSPLTRPRRSMDRFAGLLPFGDWIFFRYLTELDPASHGGLPTLVRDIWRRAAVRGPRKSGAYSIRAVEAELRSRRIDPTQAFAGFVAANRVPQSAYEEGAAQHYPSARQAKQHRLGGKRKRSEDRLVVDHLASATVRFVPSHAAPRAALRVDVSGPRTPGAWLAVVTRRDDGDPQRRLVRLRGGHAHLGGLAFSSADVTWVEVAVVNGSTRYRCDRGTLFSCHGAPVDDGASFRLRARVVRG